MPLPFRRLLVFAVVDLALWDHLEGATARMLRKAGQQQQQHQEKLLSETLKRLQVLSPVQAQRSPQATTQLESADPQQGGNLKSRLRLPFEQSIIAELLQELRAEMESQQNQIQYNQADLAQQPQDQDGGKAALVVVAPPSTSSPHPTWEAEERPDPIGREGHPNDPFFEDDFVTDATPAGPLEESGLTGFDSPAGPPDPGDDPFFRKDYPWDGDPTTTPPPTPPTPPPTPPAPAAATSCITRSDPRTGSSWSTSTVSPPGTLCVFGVDARDEGSHCVMDADLAYGSFGWCWTSATRSSWGSCSETCPLVGHARVLGQGLDVAHNKVAAALRLLNATAAAAASRARKATAAAAATATPSAEPNPAASSAAAAKPPAAPGATAASLLHHASDRTTSSIPVDVGLQKPPQQQPMLLTAQQQQALQGEVRTLEVEMHRLQAAERQQAAREDSRFGELKTLFKAAETEATKAAEADARLTSLFQRAEKDTEAG